MNKIIGLIIVAVIAYLFVIKDGSPDTVSLNGQTYGPKILEKSNDSNSTLYRYMNKSVDNNDYVLILYPDSDTGGLDSWSDLFSRHFSSQGFSVEKSGYNKIGTKDNSKIYMVPLYTKEVLAIYVLENTDNTNMPKGYRAFDIINNIQFN